MKAMIKSILISLGTVFERFSKLIIWSLSIIFALFLMVELAFLGGVVWLNSQDGKDWTKTQIMAATEASGYNIDYQKLSYHTPQSIRLIGLEISDEQGMIAQADEITLHPDVIGVIGMRRLGLSLGIKTLTLHRLPESKTKEEDKEPTTLSPFSLPDIYFKSLAINSFDIETLNINEKIFGTALTLSPSLNAKLNLSKIAQLNAALNITQASSPLPAWLPENVKIDANFDPQSLLLTLNKANADNANLDANIMGDINLGEDRSVDITGSAHVKELSAFASGINGNAQIKASLSGPFDTLKIDASGGASGAFLSERGLGDVEFTIIDDNIAASPLGQASLNTTYKEKPIKISTLFDKKKDTIRIKNINATAPDIALNGNVMINTKTSIADGLITVKASNLSPYSDLIGTNIAGSINADITLSDQENTQSAAIKASINNAAYDTITLKTADLTATIKDIKTPWPSAMTLKANGLRPTSDIIMTSVDATITQKENDFYALALNMNGNALQDFKANGGATISGIQKSEISANDINLKFTTKGSLITLNGMANTQELDVTLKSNAFNLANLPIPLPEQFTNLSMNADAKISGAMNAPQIMGNFDLTPIAITKNADITLSAKANYNNGEASLNVTGVGDAVETMRASAAIPLKLSLNPFIFEMPQSTPLSGKADINASAKTLSAILLPVGQKMSGAISAQATIGGTVGAPDITADVLMENGTYTMDEYGIALSDINMTAGADEYMLTVKSLTAIDGKGGTLDASGQVHYTNPENTKIDMNVKDFLLLDSDLAKGSLSASLDLEGRAKGYAVSGDIDLGEFNINIPERFQSTIPELNIVEKNNSAGQTESLKSITLDMKINAKDRIFVRGWGLDAEFGGKLDVDGTLDDPKINGEFSSKRGRYEEFGRRFTLDRALLRFLGSVPPSPYLDIVATTDADDIKASVNLTGEVQNPEIKLTSVPSLPQDEIMSQILFGQNLTKISPFQAIQLKQTLDRFTGKGGGGLDPLGTLRNITGLDDIRIDTNDEGEATAGVGKYLSEDVYLELEKGAGEQSGTAKIQVELTPNINLESEVGQDAQAGAGVMWKWDY